MKQDFSLALNWMERVLDKLNRCLLALSMLALMATACVLTYAVATRDLFKMPTDWQDDVSVFMLIGVSFGCAAQVQSTRGHIGIDVLDGILPQAWNRWRLLGADCASLLFCSFFSWKSWTLFVGSLERRANHQFNLRAAALDSIRHDGLRHEFAGPAIAAASRGAVGRGV